MAGVSAIAAPAGILAAVSCTASVAVAQSPNLPPLPPPLQTAMSEAPPSVGLPNTDATKVDGASDATNIARGLLVRARAALSEGRNEVATQLLGQAIAASQGIPELAREVQSTRGQFAEKSIPNLHIDQAVTAAQSSLSGSRAAAALRNRSANTSPASTLPMPNASGATVPPPGLLASSPAATPNNSLRNQAVALATQAKLALDRGDVANAKKFVDQAQSLRVPDSEYEPGQLRPWNVALDVDRAERQRMGSQVMQASSNLPVASSPFGQASGVQNANAQSPMGVPATGVQPSLYQPNSDLSRVAPASGVLSSLEETESGQELFDKGIKALSAGNSEAALKQFKAAWQKQSELDPNVRAQIEQSW
jgi:general secretion pathway protein D